MEDNEPCELAKGSSELAQTQPASQKRFNAGHGAKNREHSPWDQRR